MLPIYYYIYKTRFIKCFFITYALISDFHSFWFAFNLLISFNGMSNLLIGKQEPMPGTDPNIITSSPMLSRAHTLQVILSLILTFSTNNLFIDFFVNNRRVEMTLIWIMESQPLTLFPIITPTVSSILWRLEVVMNLTLLILLRKKIPKKVRIFFERRLKSDLSRIWFENQCLYYRFDSGFKRCLPFSPKRRWYSFVWTSKACSSASVSQT